MGGDQLPRPPCRVGNGLAVAPGRAFPVVHRTREDETDPHPAGRVDHGPGVLVAGIVKVEEVDARRRAVEQHLGEREGGAERDPRAVELLRERIEHPVAPAHEVEVVAEASQERLRSEEHTSELQSQSNLVCRLLLEKKKKAYIQRICLIIHLASLTHLINNFDIHPDKSAPYI